MNDSWESINCALCESPRSTPILRIPHPDAPGGFSNLVACADCGLRRLDPRPKAEVVSRYYEAAGAADYNAFVGRKRSPGIQAVWDALRDGYARPLGQSTWGRILSPATGAIASWAFDINIRLNRRRGIRVLEVGAGYGDLLIYLAARGCETLGTDLSAVAAAKAAEYGVEVRIGHLSDLRLSDSSFDVAIMCHSLEHVPDPNAELAELHRLLVPRGCLHIAVPNGHAVRLGLDGLAFAHLSFPLHNWFFDAKTLTRLLIKHGFRIVGEPRTTTRHHALKAWVADLRFGRLALSTRRFVKFLNASCRARHGGDVLRVIAEKTSG